MDGRILNVESFIHCGSQKQNNIYNIMQNRILSKIIGKRKCENLGKQCPFLYLVFTLILKI